MVESGVDGEGRFHGFSHPMHRNVGLTGPQLKPYASFVSAIFDMIDRRGPAVSY